MNNTNNQTIVAPWTGPLLESETVVPVKVETQHGFNVIEIESLEQLRDLFQDGAYLRISPIRGYWLCLPVEAEAR